MEKTLITDVSELSAVLKDVVKTAISEINAEKTGEQLYTVNQVRKRLHKAHVTIKRLIEKGYIKTTKDGLISEAALNEYLQKA